MARANSTEFDPATPYPVIHMMDEQRSITDKGGTMRLGTYECIIEPNTRAFEIYSKKVIGERHRHRYEFNMEFRGNLGAKGLKPGGLSPDGKLVELVEYSDHPWFVGCQFHPEFKSRPMEPHPLFASYIGACVEHKKRLFRNEAAFAGASEEKEIREEKLRKLRPKGRKLGIVVKSTKEAPSGSGHKR
jgi:CTP synthase